MLKIFHCKLFAALNSRVIKIFFLFFFLRKLGCVGDSYLNGIFHKIFEVARHLDFKI